ncbi:EamA family transporter [Gammaproteobacteria bacterium AB-CW1]|uniref:EamA family transporter n=1 Tax=Natronospira elongata TaxID=3110268 RepID=A0AAP6JDT3_9GAMM|nr:EamA family transporter [Gammaproteobacteria bacterium AB-CW1]
MAQPRTLTSPSPAMAGALLVAGAACLWGTAGVASRWIYESETATALEIGFWRMGLAAPLLLALAAIIAPRRPVEGLRPLGLTLLMGLCLAGFQAGYFSAIAATGVAMATLLAICTIPILTALMAWPVYGEAPSARVGMALLAAVIGMILVVSGSGGPELPGAAGLRLGLPMALAASFCFAVLTLAGRGLPAEQDPLWTTALSLTVAAVALAVVVMPGNWALPPNQGPTWPALAWIALMPTAVAYVLFYAGLRLVSSGTAGLLILAEPLTANILAWLLHGERLGGWGWLGAALLLAAMGLAVSRERQGRT